MVKKIMMSAKLPKLIQQKMLEKIIHDGYRMRGKSKWIVEAIERFLQIDNYPELVDIASEMEELSDILSVRISPELATELDKAVIVIRTSYPALEGVKSGIIRASIIQRLIRD